MIEAAHHPSLGIALRRRLVASEAPRASLTADLRFFATAYVGALAFFLAWLA